MVRMQHDERWATLIHQRMAGVAGGEVALGNTKAQVWSGHPVTWAFVSWSG